MRKGVKNLFINKKRKTKKLISLVLLAVILCLFILIFSITQGSKKETNVTYPNIYNYINSVTVDNLSSFLEDNRKVIYFGRPSCSDCDLFEPELIEIIEDRNLENEITYVNIDKIHKDKDDWYSFRKLYNIKYTPTLAIYENKKQVSKIEWTPKSGLSIKKLERWITTSL